MDDSDMAMQDWCLPRRWKWRNERWGRVRVVHIKTPKPDYDAQDREAPWPALCGVDIRFGHETDSPLAHGYSRDRACKRCVALFDKTASC